MDTLGDDYILIPQNFGMIHDPYNDLFWCGCLKNFRNKKENAIDSILFFVTATGFKPVTG